MGDSTEDAFPEQPADSSAETVHAPVSGVLNPGSETTTGSVRQPADLQSPQQFGDYEILAEIARGGMGIVYRARQRSLNRLVALKMILTNQLANAEDVLRFRQEAEAAANLEHPGVVPIYEVGCIDGQHYFSMGLIRGESLAARVQQGPLPQREAAEMTRQIASAIGHAHEQGVIHRDLKPANILLDENGHPRVTDFGLAKVCDTDQNLTATGQILGTPYFMPPEQAAGQLADIGPAADIYSTGAILYNLLTARPPFQAATIMETLNQVIEQLPVPPRQLNVGIDIDLEAICLKCLEKDPADRYASMESLAEDLRRYLAGEPVSVKPVTTLARAWRTVRQETRHTEVMRRWGKVWTIHAPLVFLLLAVTNLLLWLDITDVTIHSCVWVVGGLALFMVVWQVRFRDSTPLTPIEKQVGKIWMMFVMAEFLTGRINHLLGLETFRLIPITVLFAGFAFGAMAVILEGSFYILAAACALCSVLMAIFPEFGPMIAAILLGPGLLIPGRAYSRKAGE